MRTHGARSALSALTIAAALGSTGCWLKVDGEHLLGPDTRKVVVEIVYGPGAEPITERYDGEPAFVRVRANLERLFAQTGKTLELPTTLDEMTLAPEMTSDDFSMGQAVDIALTHRRTTPTDDTAVIVVVYHPGKLDGLSWMYGDTRSYNGVTALAMGAVRGGYPGAVEREEVLLTHELGHQVGLVDAGLPMVAPHVDDGDGGHHCANPRCVMAINSGLDSIGLPTFMSDVNTILFGPECLADVDAAASAKD